MKLTLTKALNLRHAISQTFERIKTQKGKICVVVPDKLSVTLEQRLFENLNIESSFDIEVITLTRLSKRILSELNVSYAPISKLGSVLLIKKILNDNKNNLKLFSSPTFSYNYSDSLFRTLTQFKSSNITIDDFIINNNISSQLQNKLEDIKLIMREYENAKCGLIDQTDRLNLLSTNIHKSKIVQETYFHFLGFVDFTSQGYTVLEQLINYSQGVNVCCYVSQNENLYSLEVFNHLLNYVKRFLLPYEIIEEPYMDSHLHQFLTNNIFGYANNTYNNNSNNINLYSAKSIDEEIEFSARDIRNQILNGKNYCDFGVAIFDLEKHVSTIRSCFEKYEINYYIDTACSLSNTQYFKFILNFLNLYANNFRLENLITLINSSFINLDLNKKVALNTYLKEINFSGNLSFLTNEEFKEELEYISFILKTININKTINVKQIKQVFEMLDTMLNIDAQLEDLIQKSSDFYNKKILAQCKSSFYSMIEEISSFYSEIPLEDFIDILESASMEQKIMPIPQSIDCVQIIDATEILTDFENLYILNCSHSNAPQVSQDIGIILDNDINNLPFEKKLTPTIKHLNKMSKFKLFNGFQMFNKTLTVSYSGSGAASSLITELSNKIIINSEPLKIQPINEVLASYKCLSKWDLIEFLSSNYSEENNKLLKTFNLSPFSNQLYLSEKNIEKLTFKEISCSALENYFKCPLLYFLNNTVKLQEERQEGIAMIDVGNLLHELAQDFYKVADRKNLNLKDFCDKKLSGYMKKDKKLNVYLNSPVHLNLIKEGVRFLSHLNYLDENSEFIPTFFEYSFDSIYNKSIPISNEVYLRGKIDRIDFANNYVRIIDYKTGNISANLKDLYYGKKLQLFLYAKVAEKIFNKQIAGTFYLPIKNSILSNENSAPYKLNGFYPNNNELAPLFDKHINQTLKSDIVNLSLNKDGDIKCDSRSNKVLSPNHFSSLLDYSVNVSKNAISEIKEGYIAPNPIKFDEQTDSCTYCKYLPICRKNSMNLQPRLTCNVNLNSFGGDQ